MATLQKTVSEIRALEVEEIDLVGGGFSLSGETTEQITMSAVSYVSNGQHITITVPDDSQQDAGISIDW